MRVQIFASKLPYVTCIAAAAAACYPGRDTSIEGPHAELNASGEDFTGPIPSERDVIGPLAADQDQGWQR